MVPTTASFVGLVEAVGEGAEGSMVISSSGPFPFAEPIEPEGGGNAVREVEADGGGEMGTVNGDLDKDVERLDRRRVHRYLGKRYRHQLPPSCLSESRYSDRKSVV